MDRVTDVWYPAEYGNGSQGRKIVHHDYDIASRISALSFDGQIFASNIVYNATSQTTSLTVGTGTNQVNENYNYNAQTGLLDSQTIVRNGTPLLNLSYDYTDANGKRTGQLTKSSNNLDHGKDRSYSYDALGRLVQATGGPSGSFWTETYSYDRYGNRTGVSTSGHSAKLEKPAEPKPNLPTDLIAKNTAIELPALLRGKDSSPISDSNTPLIRPKFDGSSAANSKAAMPLTPQSGSAKIAFASNRDGTDQIYVMNADGSSQTRITNNQTNDDAPRWSSNNSRIVFQSDRDNPFCGIADIYVMNVDGSGQARLTTDPNDDSAPVWSPDGSKIAFQSFRNGSTYQIYLMNADGSGQTNISNSGANDVQPAWSPDGSKIAFASDRGHTGVFSVYTMSTNGAGQSNVTNNSYDDEQPAWSPDSLHLAFMSERDSTTDTWTETDDDGNIINRSRVNINKEIYVMYANGSGQTRLTNALENDESPSWSGDGTKIVFRSDRERDNSDPVPQIWSMNSDGNGQTNLSNNQFGDYAPSWQFTGTGGSSAVPADGATSRAYDTSSNRITTAGFTYDAAGNEVRALLPGGGGYQRFRYDAANRMVQVVADNNSTAISSYSYGDSNERLTSDEGGYRTYFDCQGGSTIAEYSESNNSGTLAWSKSYVYLGARLLSTLTPNGAGGEALEFDHPDRLGTRLVTYPSNGVFFEQQTLPFGTALNETPPAGGSFGSTNRRFTTYDRSATTGLDYAYNRHYDPQQGRFTQVDPAGIRSASIVNPQTLNLYAYCTNDPINHTDPTGRGFFSSLWHGIKKILSNKWVMLALTIALTVIAVGAALHIINLTRALTTTLGASGFFDASGASIPLTITIGHTLSTAGWIAAGLGAAAAIPTATFGLKSVLRNVLNAGLGWLNAQIPRPAGPGGTPTFEFQTTEQALSAAQRSVLWNVLEFSKLVLTLHKDCRDYIGQDAFDALGRLWNEGRFKYFNGVQFSAAQEGDVWASTMGSLFGGKRIVLSYNFFSDADVSEEASDVGISPLKERSLTVLHELKHYLGAHHKDDAESKEWDRQIIKRCLSN